MQKDEKGICRLSIVPVRKEPSDQSEMVTQLLFGDHYTILSATPDQKWLHIRIYYDQYEGWIDRKQHNGISEAYYHDLIHNEFKISTEITTSVLYKKKTLQIVIGSILPIAHNELFELDEQFAFNGESKSLGQKGDFDFIRATAMKYLNAPYLWGGKTPFGVDCSGFVQMVYKISGYKLKRDTSDQVRQGQLVSGLEQSRPGDLAFFSNENDKISHVGIILENYAIIHAHGHVKVDLLDQKGIFDKKNNSYSHTLGIIKRVLR